jgi:hypothetical protein
MNPPEYAAAITTSFLQGFNQQRKQELVQELVEWQGDRFPSFDEVLVSKLTQDNERVMAMSFKLWNIVDRG